MMTMIVIPDAGAAGGEMTKTMRMTRLGVAASHTVAA
jgi:hypothetical protein